MMNKQYPLESSPLYRLSNLRVLAELLDVPVKELRHVDRLINYHTFEKPKANGDFRVVSSPDPFLKKIQRRILLYLRRINTPEWLISGKKGKSYIDNARYHVKSHFVITADISKFFDHCRCENVYCLYKNTFHMAEDIATVLTKLTTLNYCIPTGTPTSQIMAFFSYRNMFNEIAALAECNHLVFTLYVDDITFSSSEQINDNVLNQIEVILKKYGHSMKKEKIRHYSKYDFKHITGVVISPDGELKVPNSLRCKIASEMHMTGDACFQSLKMKGRIIAARSIVPNCYPRLMRAFFLTTK